MIKILRMIMMAAHFIVAGVAGLLVCLARPFNPDNSRLVAIIYAIPALRILGLDLRLELSSLQGHGKSIVIIANHQSNYDLFVIGAAVPRRTVTIGKKSLKWVPLFGQIFWLAGNVLIDRDSGPEAKKAMLITTDILQNKDTSIWIFAEGTRNKGKGLLPFKKGAFRMAVESGTPIVMVCASSYCRDMDLSKLTSSPTSLVRRPTPLTRKGRGFLPRDGHARPREC